MQSLLRDADRPPSPCRICGFAELRTDEVIDRGVVFLADCPRCESRWTSREPDAPGAGRSPWRASQRSPRVAREVAPAA